MAKRGISRENAERLDLLNQDIDATPPEERDIFNGCLSPFWAQDVSRRGATRRKAALARNRDRTLTPGTILRDRLEAQS